ncbi:MAG: hypothetical protein ACOY2B_04905 [Pseudomonadota bacterium]
MTGGKKSGATPLDQGVSIKKAEQNILAQRELFEADAPLALREILVNTKKISSDRMAARIAILGVIEFLKLYPEMFEHEMLIPLSNLAAALGELDKGKVAPMLTPAQHLPHRQTDPLMRIGTKALAVQAIEILMKHCFLKPREAAREVVKTLQKHGIPMGRDEKSTDADVRAVLRWRTEIKNADQNSDIGSTYLALGNPPIMPAMLPVAIQSCVLTGLDETLQTNRLRVLSE